MAFYPAFLDLSNKECLVVGGGLLGLQKAEALSKAGARVKVVAPRIVSKILKLENVHAKKRPFSPADVVPTLKSGSRVKRGERPWLVVAATDNEKLHKEIADLCRREHIWVNVVDRPPLCDFIVPSVTQRGPVTFAVSTGGASPALAKFLGARLRTHFGPEVGRMGAELKKHRKALLRIPMAERRAVLAGLITETWLRAFRKNPRSAGAAFRKQIIKATE